MRIGYLNHTGLMSGAERSLLPLLRGLPEEFSAVMICPEGPMRDAADALGVPTVTIDAVEAGIRLHPTRTPAGVAAIARAARQVRTICRSRGVDILHANSTRSGLIGAAARGTGGPLLIVSVHDALPSTPLARLTRLAIQRRASAVVACTRYIAENFGGPRTEVVYYGIELDRMPDPAAARRVRAELGIADGQPVIGVVGQITPWKGQDTAIRALNVVRRTVPEAVLLLAGEVKFVGRGRRFDNAAYMGSLKDLCDQLEVGDSVRFLGERRDVPELLGSLDLLLAPSWEEPGGVAVQEAMLAGTPALVTSVGGLGELIEDGDSGRLLAPHDHRLWAEAILELVGEPGRRAEMAERARDRIARFNPERFIEATTRIYRGVMSEAA